MALLYIYQDLRKGENCLMILKEFTLALTELIIKNNESIILSDTDSICAEEVAYYLSILFHSLKCDYKIKQISATSYEIELSC